MNFFNFFFGFPGSRKNGNAHREKKNELTNSWQSADSAGIRLLRAKIGQEKLMIVEAGRLEFISRVVPPSA